MKQIVEILIGAYLLSEGAILLSDIILGVLQ
jgi:hypothetical protein